MQTLSLDREIAGVQARQELLVHFERIEHSTHWDFRLRQRLLHTFRLCAERHREVFLDLVGRIPFDEGALRAGIYEALAEDAGAWESFFLCELELLFEALECFRSRFSIVRSLQAFSCLWRTTDDAFRTRLRCLLLQQTASPSVPVRRAATELLGYFTYPENTEAIERLEQLTRDEDRHVRWHAYELLAELKGYPSLSDVPLLHLIWIRLAQWFEEL